MVRWAFWGFALLLCDLGLQAQDDVAATQQRVTIRGAVVDGDTGVPVAGATVALRHADAPAPLDTVVTEAPGTFELSVNEPGNYTVEASAPGYLDAVSSESHAGIAVGAVEFEPGASEVPHWIELKLLRSSGLTGVVVDGDTRKPVPLTPVRAIRLWWFRGRRQATEERIVFTDDEGVFHIDSLTPGDYAVMLGNTSAAVAQMRAQADQPKTYPVMVWPEGAGDSGFLPLAVRPGSELNLGVIGYSQIIPPRIRAPECAGQATADTSIRQQIAQRIGGAWFELSHDPGSTCGWIAPIPPVSRGRYRLTFLSSAPSGFRMAEDEITIGGDDDAPEVKARMFPMAPVTWTITCECEEARTASAEAVKIGISPVYGESGFSTSFGAGEPGRAAVEGDAFIDVIGIPAGLIVKTLTFNGAEAGKMVSMHLGSPVSVKVILSDKPATITGTVESGGRPLLEEHVVIAKWPIPAGVDYVDFYSAVIDDGGSFTIKNLPPGEYRATAVAPAQWLRRDMPNAVAEWLAPADGFTVAEGETGTIRIKAP